jgi:hypothetical protein
VKDTEEIFIMARQEPQKDHAPSTFNRDVATRDCRMGDRLTAALRKTVDASQTKRCLDVANYPALSAFSKSA